MVLQFELAGNQGGEKIKIISNWGSIVEPFTLSTNWKAFSYHVTYNQPITIHFMKGDKDDAIFLKDAETFDLKESDLWIKDCEYGNVTTLVRCPNILRGVLRKPGNYRIKPKQIQGV